MESKFKNYTFGGYKYRPLWKIPFTAKKKS